MKRQPAVEIFLLLGLAFLIGGVIWVLLTAFNL
jgi:hypothetical protein